jgi:hypothetical protein
MTTRKYSSRSQQTTLAANLTDAATTCTVVSGSALLGGATVPAGTTFTVVIDPDTALEEIVDVTVVSTNVLTITRGVEMQWYWSGSLCWCCCSPYGNWS